MLMMLIVKHVEKSGYESVRPCRTVSFFPPGDANLDDSFKAKGMLMAYGCDPESKGPVDEDGNCRYGGGRVFVMSVEGRTVSNYDFG